MKKFNKLLLFTLTVSVLLSTVAMASSDISIYLDNDYVRLTDVNGTPVYPFVQNGSTYVPLRGVAEMLDCTVGWDGANRNILIYKDTYPENKSFRNNSDDIKIYLNNEEKTLYDANGAKVKPIVKNGTTYVPLRGISNLLGYYVEWEGSTKSVYVWKDEVSPNGVPLDFLRPYERDTYTYYESDGKTTEIDGNEYTNAISDGEALFNLDGKYTTLSCVVGFTYDSSYEENITFVADGNIIEKIVLEPGDPAENIEIDLDNCLQLKIISDYKTGLGDIRFFGD